MKGSPAGEELAAPIINEKYAKDLPLYRIEDALFDKKAAISRQTMSNRLISVSDCYLTPLYECMKEHLLAMDIIHADETPVQTLHHQDVSTNVQDSMWLYRSGAQDSNIMIYDNQSGENKSILKAF